MKNQLITEKLPNNIDDTVEAADTSEKQEKKKIALNGELQKFVQKFDGDYFVTAAFNREVGIRGAEKTLQYWHNCVNKKLYGNKWYELEAAERMQYIAFVEHIDSNLHWHLTVKIGGDCKSWRFKLLAKRLWEKANKSGSMRVQKLETAQDKENISYYVTKETWKLENYNNFKLSA